MTAINVFLESNRAHIFTDEGHHEGTVLRYLAPKAFVIEKYGTIFAWSGISVLSAEILRAIDVAGYPTTEMLFRNLPIMIRSFGWKDPFSAIFVSMKGGVPFGLIVEKRLDGQIVTYNLEPGNVVKSLPSDIQFDVKDVVGSAVSMMEDQKARHKIVAGSVVHFMHIGHKIVVTKVKKWNDIQTGLNGMTHAAKIVDLTVDTINFQNNSTFAVQMSTVSDGSTITVINEESLPVIFTLSGIWNYSAVSSSSSASIVYRLTRVRGSLWVASGGAKWSGNGSMSGVMSSSGVDQDSIAGDQYTIQYQYFATGTGSMAFTTGTMKIASIKR